jgi:cytochrome c-type biogenesis protein CcmE
MAQATWEKTSSVTVPTKRKSNERLKFIIGGVLILAAVAYLVISGTLTGATYFMTVDDLLNNPAYVGKTVRIAGAVDGKTIQYDSKKLLITFSIAHIPNQSQDLAQTLHAAVNNPQAKRVEVRVEKQVKPDLLQHEAQAILTGQLGKDGVFHATELLLKCPTRFDEAKPNQDTSGPKA